MRNTQKKQSGFTLVEITVVMIISGLVFVILLTSFFSWQEILRKAETEEKMAYVSDALSAYVARNFRIPCPASPAGAGPEPFGIEIGAGANAAILGSCDGAGEAAGIIPFASLGISADFIRDGWGNYITYQVTPGFTESPEDDTIRVHAKCRTTSWIEGAVLSGALNRLDGGRNVAAQKARFCCKEPQAAAEQTTIFITPNAPTAPTPANLPSIVFTPEGDNNYYQAVDVIADHYFVDTSNPIAAGGAQAFYDNRIYGGGESGVFGHTDVPVYAIISHGSNGAGAWIGNGTMNRNPDNGGASETVNADPNNQRVYDLEHDSSNDATYYDDIVVWQTQSNLMARLRRDSCVVP